jgi:trans-aconitate methyltransferase
MPSAERNRWAAATYDGDHAFVFEHGSDVVSLLDPDPSERVLDLGCGTGHLTREIAETGSDVIGVDSSPEMVSAARTNHPDCRFVHADARRLPLEASFDAVFSNAALHWVDEQDRALSSVAAALEPGGRFVAEMGGTGNVAAIVGALETELERRGHEPASPWYFPSVGEYAARLEAHGFEVRHATLFDRPTELENGEDGLVDWLAMFGDAFLSPLSAAERRGVVASVEDRLRPERFEDGRWVADYRRLRFVAVLPADRPSPRTDRCDSAPPDADDR